jgi:hypothetical protein
MTEKTRDQRPRVFQEGNEFLEEMATVADTGL